MFDQPNGNAGPSADLGLDADDAVAMELDLLNNGQANAQNGTSKAGTSKLMKVRIFINMDEDDTGNQNKEKINPKDIFKRDDPKLSFYVDVSFPQFILLYKSAESSIFN